LNTVIQFMLDKRVFWLLRDSPVLNALSDDNELKQQYLNELTKKEKRAELREFAKRYEATRENLRASAWGSLDKKSEDRLVLAHMRDKLPKDLKELKFYFDRVKELANTATDSEWPNILLLQKALDFQMRDGFVELAKNIDSNHEEIASLLEFMLKRQLFFLSKENLPTTNFMDLQGKINWYRQAYRLEMFFQSPSEAYVVDEAAEKAALRYWSFEKLRDRLLELTNRSAPAPEVKALKTRLLMEFEQRFKAIPQSETKMLVAAFHFMTEHKVDWILPSDLPRASNADGNLAQAQRAYLESLLLKHLIGICLDPVSNRTDLDRSRTIFIARWPVGLDEQNLFVSFKRHFPRQSAVFERVWFLVDKGAAAFVQRRKEQGKELKDIIGLFVSNLESSKARKACIEIENNYRQGQCDWDATLKALVEFQCSHPELGYLKDKFSKYLFDVKHQRPYLEKLLGALVEYAKTDGEEAKRQGAEEVYRLANLLLTHTWPGARTKFILSLVESNPEKLRFDLFCLESFLASAANPDQEAALSFMHMLSDKMQAKLAASYQASDEQE